MRCKSCGYQLWDLTARTCPECGSGFRPSEFEFRPNAVRFCCPHCRQAYYGTDAKGHLVPRAFDCVSCGRRIDMDETILLPTEGMRDLATAAAGNPWIEPGRRGLFRRWFDTAIMAMVRPTELARGTPDHTPLAKAWWFAILTHLLITIASVVLVMTCIGAIFALAASTGSGGMGTGGAGFMPMFLSQGIMQAAALPATALAILLWIGSTHALLKITGPLAGTLRTTTLAILFSSGAYALSLVPCVGWLAGIWWLVSAILMLAHMHQISGARASLITIPTGIVSFIVAFLGSFFVIGLVLPGISTTYAVPGRASLETVAAAVEHRAALHGGWTNADHALQLIVDHDLEPWDLDPDLAWLEYQMTTSSAYQHEIDHAAEEIAEYPLPSNVVAHRVGRFVFTYHGIDAATAPAGLWLIVDVGPPVRVYTSDTKYITIPPAQMAQRLAEQNESRAELGLPPLPDPTTVSTIRPAVSADDDASP